MELNQIRYFIKLCQTLNFTRAAEQCNISQPAFTRSIQKLESEFGGQFLFRERSHTQLTELGREIRYHFETILNAADAAFALAHAKRNLTTADLRIGFGPGIGAVKVARAVREITHTLPNVAIHFEEAGPATLVEKMLKDCLDCALVSEDCDLSERINRWPLYSDRAVVVLPQDHKLVSLTAMNAHHLLDETILVSDVCGDFTNRLAKMTSYPLRLQRCNGGTHQIFDLIDAGAGVALLSDHLRFAPPLTFRPLLGPEISRRILLVTASGRPLNFAANAFIKVCRSQGFA